MEQRSNIINKGSICFSLQTHFILNSHSLLPPSLSLARCVWTAFALPCPALSTCLFSGLSDLLSILQGGVASEESRIFSCRWSPPGWLLDEYLRACRHKSTTSSNNKLCEHSFNYHHKLDSISIVLNIMFDCLEEYNVKILELNLIYGSFMIQTGLILSIHSRISSHTV